MKTSHAIQKKAKSNTPISSIAKKKNAVQAEKNSSNAPVKIIGKTVERPGFSSQTSSVIQPKPTEALDKITELWKSETQEKLRRTAPPEIANQIKRIEAENKGHRSNTTAPARYGQTQNSFLSSAAQLNPVTPTPLFPTRGISSSTSSSPAKTASDYRIQTHYKPAPLPAKVPDTPDLLTEIPRFLKNAGGFIIDNSMAGISQFNGGLARTADFFLPDPLTPKPVQNVIDHFKKNEELFTSIAENNNQRRFGKGGEFFGGLLQGTAAAAPQAIMAFLTADTSLEGQVTEALVRAGQSPSVVQMVQSAMKKPGFWASFSQTVGRSYEDAKAGNASEWEAQTAALASSLINAGIEVCSGIGELAHSGSYGLKDWGKSALGEGLEEVEQGITSNIINKALFDHDKAWFSLEDEDAVINPYRAAQEFAGGTFAGGVLSGAGAAANMMRGHLNNSPGTTLHRNETISQTAPLVLDNDIIRAFPDAKTDMAFYSALDKLITPAFSKNNRTLHEWNLRHNSNSDLLYDLLQSNSPAVESTYQQQTNSITQQAPNHNIRQYSGLNNVQRMSEFRLPDGRFNLDSAIDSYKNFLTNLPSHYRMYLENALDAVEFEITDDPGTSFLFDGRTQRDHFVYNPRHEDFNEYSIQEAFTHELAHRYDRYFAHSMSSDLFKQGLLEAQATFNSNPEFFIEFASENSSNGFLTDIVSAICAGKHPIPGGHNPAYWNMETRVRECFANLFSLDALGYEKSISSLRQFFPTLWQGFQELVEDL